jgi:hypothetical protein
MAAVLQIAAGGEGVKVHEDVAVAVVDSTIIH